MLLLIKNTEANTEEEEVQCVCVCVCVLSKHKQRCLPSLAWTSIGERSASAARGDLHKCFCPSLPRPLI